jgi:hypothetical protein
VASDFRRLNEIGWKDRALLLEAARGLLIASLAIRLLPFRVLASRLAGPAPAHGGRSSADFAEIGRIRWAVEACARRLPWRIVCFQKGLAVHRMLLRRGIASTLHYGVAQKPERGLSAHVWVTYQGEAVIGGEEATGYTCLATFPALGLR